MKEFQGESERGTKIYIKHLEIIKNNDNFATSYIQFPFNGLRGGYEGVV
jgi:hypothetical protein